MFKCLDNGRLDSFDHPFILIKDCNSILNNFISKLDHNEANALRKLAEISYKNKK